MPKRLMWVKWEDGAELSESHKRPGDFSPLTRDLDGKLGHATLSDADDYELGSLADGMDDSSDDVDEYVWTKEDLDALAALLSAIAIALKPHVERWWKVRALPAIKATNESLRDRFARARSARRRTESTDGATSIDLAPAEAEVTVDRNEAERRLLAALVARAFSDEQFRILLNARIEDADGNSGLGELLAQFSSEQVADHVNLVLENNPDFLDEFTRVCRGEPLRAEVRPAELTSRPIE